MKTDLKIEERKPEDKIRTVNCFACSKVLTLNEVKKHSKENSDTRYFCFEHYKKRFGKKKKLIKRV